MSAARVNPVTSFAPAVDIAHAEGRRSVGPNEDQLIVGYLGRTCNVHDRIVAVMADKGVTWTKMAKQLGLSRQALVAATKRRHVQFPRLYDVFKILAGVERGTLSEERLNEVAEQLMNEYVGDVFGIACIRENCRLL